MLSGIPSFLPHFLTLSRVQYVSELIQIAALGDNKMCGCAVLIV